MDYGNCIGAIDSDFSWSGSNDVGLVLLMELFGLLIVLVIWEYSRENTVELGESCGKRPRNLYGHEYDGDRVAHVLYILFADGGRILDGGGC